MIRLGMFIALGCRLTKEEIANYLLNRHLKGFNLIQAAVLAAFDGLKKPNRYGLVPFRKLDPEGKYRMINIPFGKPVTINTSFIPNCEVTLWWFDPRTGNSKKAGDFMSGKITLQTPSPEKK